MSANIHWRPVSTKDKSIDVPALSAFMETMAGVGLTLPCTVRQSDTRLLMGMAAVFGKHERSRPNPYHQIIALLQKHDEIELWVVY